MNGQGNGDEAVIYLTKELLLKGVEHVEEVETEMGVFRLRPLTDGEKAKVDALAVRGMKGKSKRSEMGDMEMEVDLESVTNNTWDISFHILAYGLSADRKQSWSPNEVKNLTLPKTVRELLVATIRRISGLESAEEMLRKFRGASRGADAGGADPGAGA